MTDALFPRAGFDAVFSDCGRYRYSLSRQWVFPQNRAPRTVTFIMLNPSTADETKDDPTIRRCVGFAQAWGFERLEIVNLFAWRSPYPDDLLKSPEPVGHANDVAIKIAAGNGEIVIGAWGSHRKLGDTVRNRAMAVQFQISVLEPGPMKDIQCLGVNADGQPKHPLYVRGSVKPVLFQGHLIGQEARS